jgi:hypothetical protein
MLDTSVVYFAFNRPEKVKLSFPEVLKWRPKKIYCFVDGPRKNVRGDSEKIKTTVAILEEYEKKFKTIEIKINRDNLGSRDSIINGLNQVARLERNFIVVEDDVILSEMAANFLHNSVRYIDQVENVVCVTAYKPVNNFPGVQFSKHFSCWGWATTSRKYLMLSDYFNCKTDLLKIESRLHDQSDGSKFYSLVWKAVLSSKRYQSWDYTFRRAMLELSQESLVMYPPVNLALNIGFDEEATRTKFGVSNQVQRYNGNNLWNPPNRVVRNSQFDKYVDLHHYHIGLRKYLSVIIAEWIPFIHPLLKGIFGPRLTKKKDIRY